MTFCLLNHKRTLELHFDSNDRYIYGVVKLSQTPLSGKYSFEYLGFTGSFCVFVSDFELLSISTVSCLDVDCSKSVFVVLKDC